MTTIPEQTDVIMKALLETLSATVCQGKAGALIKVRRHVWRDADYVGVVNGKVAVWQGWSVNLRVCRPAFGTVYIDYAVNGLTVSERTRLFGEDFSRRIATMDAFVFAFITRLPVEVQGTVVERGFILRKLPRRLHGGLLADAKDFNQALA